MPEEPVDSPAAPPPLAPMRAAPISGGPWLHQHAAGVVALVLGVVGFCVVAMTQKAFWATPSFRITVPFFIAAVAAAAVSFQRRERAVAIPLLGVGLAAAAMVLGWFLIMGIVIVVTAVIILIMHAVM